MEGATDPSMLEDRVFFKLGLFIHDHNKSVLVLGLISCILMTSLVGLGANWSEAFGEDNVESLRASDMLSDSFKEENGSTGHSFTFLVYHPTLTDNDTEWQQTIYGSLSKFSNRDDVSILYSWQVDEIERLDYVAHTESGFIAQNIITIEGDRTHAKAVFDENQESVKLFGEFVSWKTEGVAIEWTFDNRITEDLVKAEIVSGPLTLIILGLVFGSIIAAFLPIGVGIATVAAAMGMTIWLSNVTDVTQYATNIITLIGIGVSIDYSLFLVNRFREELASDRDVRTAIAMSTATAGKAVFFSGITVAIGLMGMLFFKNTSLPSLGIGGTVAVSIAMVYSTIVLPAVMSILGKRVDSGKIPFSFNLEAKETGVWANIANKVMNHPWKVLVPVLILLLGAGAPFLYAEFSLSSWSALPPDDESRLGKEVIEDIWPDQSSNQIFLVIELDGTDAFSEDNLRAQYQYIKAQIGDDRVRSASGIGLPDSSMNESQVISYWSTPNENLDEQQIALRDLIRDSFVNDEITFILLNLEGEQTSVESRNVVEDIRANRNVLTEQLSGENDYLSVAGFAAYNADTLNSISDNLPMALGFIFLATSVLIFIQVRSVIIPIKAIVMNILSVSASFGMLVWVFQWGYGEALLNFTAQPIDSGNPVIMFCIVFGLSMDYEVLMLSRIHEEWERTGDNTLAVANGLQKTGGLITGAAAIMIVVFGSFGLSSVIILKQIGLGLALAILIDATLVRALVVPATMRLMGKWNWWSPSFLAKRKTNNISADSESE